MEYLDIYNAHGEPLGIIKSKKEAHEKGLWHKSVHVWIVSSKGEILVQKRAPTVSNHANQWDISCAGHCSAGESDIVSALRESEEELGVILKPEDLTLIGTVKQTSRREGYINNEINPVYVVKKDLDLTKVTLQKEEVSEVKFLPLQEFQRIIESKDSSFVSHPEEYNLLFEFLKKTHEA